DSRASFIYDSMAAVDSTRAQRARDSLTIGADTAGDPGHPTSKNHWTTIDHSVRDSVIDITSFNYGVAGPKFTNKTSTGGPGSQTTMIDTDFPIFRLAEAYLIYAEAAVRTGTNVTQGVTYFNLLRERALDRKSTRLNSSHLGISYAVFCLKKKTIPLKKSIKSRET